MPKANSDDEVSKKKSRKVRVDSSSTSQEMLKSKKVSAKKRSKNEAQSSSLAAALLEDSSSEDENSATISPGQLTDIETKIADFKRRVPTAQEWTAFADLIPAAFAVEHNLQETVAILRSLGAPLKAKKRDLVLRTISSICVAATKALTAQKRTDSDEKEKPGNATISTEVHTATASSCVEQNKTPGRCQEAEVREDSKESVTEKE